MRTIALAVILAAACFATTRNVTCSGAITGTPTIKAALKTLAAKLNIEVKQGLKK